MESPRLPLALEPGRAATIDGILASTDPATGKLIGTVPIASAEDVRSAVADVATVQPFWAALSLADRARYMRRASEIVLDEMDDIARLISREQGKVLTEAYGMELLPTAEALRWCAESGPEILADERVPFPQPFLKHKSSFFSYEPLGVVGIIAPWNYPWSIPFGEVAIALMAGNGVVLKPAELTPLIGERIKTTFDRAGFPEGLVRTVHGEGDVGAALVESDVAKVFFTGSVEVGRQVGAKCAQMMKGSVLELGGKDAQIVCSDARLSHAVAGGAWGAFANAGQTCAGIERAYVMRDVVDEYVAGVVSQARRLRVGNQLQEGVDMGPMASAKQWEKVKELVDDALASGATAKCGGPADPGLAGHFYSPTVLTGVTQDMRIMREEVFGPVLPVLAVDSEEEAIEKANDCAFGLGTSIWTRDRAKGKRMARLLETGMAWINDHGFTHGACQCSWGGVKQSGLGRSHSKFGFYECVNIKNVTADPGYSRNLWWYPYGRDSVEALRSAGRFFYSTSGRRLHALTEGAGSIARVVARSFGKVPAGDE